MKKTMALIPLFLVLASGIGCAAEASSWRENPGQADERLEARDMADTTLSAPAQKMFEGQELREEELGRVRGGAMGVGSPDFVLPRVSDIILWDEAKTRGSEAIHQGTKWQTMTIISYQGR